MINVPTYRHICIHMDKRSCVSPSVRPSVRPFVRMLVRSHTQETHIHVYLCACARMKKRSELCFDAGVSI